MTSPSLPSRTKDETGAVLVIALVITTILGLVVAALLAQSQVHIENTTVVANHQLKVYAADAGIRYGIDEVTVNPTLCPSASPTPTAVGTVTIKAPTPFAGTADRQVNVTCQTTKGSSTGAAGWAIITTSGATDSLVAQSGSSKQVTGPVFVNGDITWLSSVEMVNGDFYRKPSGASCPLPPNFTTQLIFDQRPPNDYFCDPAFAVPSVAHVAPLSDPAFLPGALQPPSIPATNCRIFAPGHYTSAPSLLPISSGVNYFASGVYYFDNINPAGNPWTVTSARIIGGAPTAADAPYQKFGDINSDFSNGIGVLGSTTYSANAADFAPTDVGNYIWGAAIPAGTKIVTVAGNNKSVTLSQPATAGGNGQDFTIVRRPACAVDSGVPGANGSGVEFIFGGTSQMKIGVSGQVELFNRSGNNPSTSDGISFLQLDASNAPAGGVSTVTGNILDTAPGNTPDGAIHGLIYAGIGTVNLNATNKVIAQILGGVVATKLTIQSGASAAGLAVSTSENNLRPRQLVITSTAKGVNTGDRDVKSVAVVTIANDAQSTTSITSWRTTYLND